MRKVYLLKTGELDTDTEMFTFHKIEVFSSLMKARFAIDNQIEVNEGWGEFNYAPILSDYSITDMVDYYAKGYTGDPDNPSVVKKIRVIIEPKELK